MGYIKTRLTYDKYVRVTLSRNGKNYGFLVHRIVAELFIIDKPEGWEEMQVNHKDGDKSHNHVDNLEYVFGTENMEHSAYELGQHGVKRVNMYNPDTDELLMTFPSITRAAEYANRSHSAVVANCKGLTKCCNIYKFRFADEVDDEQDIPNIQTTPFIEVVA